MALTLVEASKIALGRDQVHRATIMELYARGSDLLAYLPFENITGSSLAFNREQTLPAAGFRAVNQAFAEGAGTTSRIVESLAIAGGDLDVDKFIVDTMGPDQRASQEAMKVMALSLSMANEIIKGDVIATPQGFDGLQVRCTGTQLITASTGGATALSLTILDQIIDQVDEPTHLIMNKTMRRRLSAAARNAGVGGYITYELDAFGRRVTFYNDLPILVADRNNLNGQIIPFTEADFSLGGAASCSIYCVSFAENGVLGLQSAEMDVRDLGEQDASPVFRTRIEWYITLGILRERSAARLWSIGDQAVVV